MGIGFRVKPLLVGEHLIPDKAAAAEGFFKKLRLLRVGSSRTLIVVNRTAFPLSA